MEVDLELGISLETYWVGLIAFAAVLLLMFFTYLTLKSGIRQVRKDSEATNLMGTKEFMGMKILRFIPPSESTMAFAGMTALTLAHLYFDVLFISGVILGWDQVILAVSLAMAFVALALTLDLYRKEFLPDILIEKERRGKIVPKREFNYT
ncbi:MAG: hypothetical protein ACE5GD_08460 [Candidatus Geothermarchaeales archaeon]